MKELNILWAEKNGKYRYVHLIKSLLIYGHDIEHAETVEQAKSFLENNTFDVVIVNPLIPKEGHNEYTFPGLEIIDDLKGKYSSYILVLHEEPLTVECVEQLKNRGLYEGTCYRLENLRPIELEKIVHKIAGIT